MAGDVNACQNKGSCTALGTERRIRQAVQSADTRRQDICDGKRRDKLGRQTEDLPLPMLYAELVLYKKGDRYWLREYEVLEDFRKLYRELDRLALGQYIMSLADRVSVVGQERSALLSLSLNSLYLLAETDRPCVHIKAVTELRVALDEGYAPELDGCMRCGKTPPPGHATLDVMGGGIVCSSCLNSGPKLQVPPDADEIREASLLIPLSDTVWAVLRYVFTAPPKRRFLYAARR